MQKAQNMNNPIAFGMNVLIVCVCERETIWFYELADSICSRCVHNSDAVWLGKQRLKIDVNKVIANFLCQHEAHTYSSTKRREAVRDANRIVKNVKHLSLTHFKCYREVFKCVGNGFLRTKCQAQWCFISCEFIAMILSVWFSLSLSVSLTLARALLPNSVSIYRLLNWLLWIRLKFQKEFQYKRSAGKKATPKAKNAFSRMLLLQSLFVCYAIDDDT